MTSPTDRQTSFDRDLAATAALALYSLVVAIGFARVFFDWGFLAELGLIVVLGHGVSFLLRRARISGWLSVPLVLVLLSWVLVALRYGETLRFLLPTDVTWDRIELDMTLVRQNFETEISPVLYDSGWALLAGVAMIVVVVMSDTFAFRADARGEALVPGGVLFVFIAALGSPRLRIVATALLIGAGIIAVAALRALHDRSRRVELSSRRTPSLAVPAALAAAVAIALVAGVVGPRLPGAHAEPLYDTKGRGGGDTTQISALVDIRSRLTNRSNVRLFRVDADEASYWRMTTLPEFDGRRFRLPRRDVEEFDPSNVDPGEGRESRQRVQVLSLEGRVIPAAPDPVTATGNSLGGGDFRILVDKETNTLLAPDELQAADLVTIDSVNPVLGADVLRSQSVSNPPDPIFLELPDDLPDMVEEQARAVTADATTPYDQARALQDWFQNEFTYSLEVQQGHSTNHIENFLRERIGYCEQFSATFAAMARTLGIPSRVAVGFTPGVQDDEGWYTVLGKNAHAWPELWFDDIGWVLFEPTPTRGAPGAEAYTGLAPAQDDSGQDALGGGAGGGTGETLPTTPPTVDPTPTTIGDGTPATTVPLDPDLIPVFPDGGGDFGGELTDGEGAAASSGDSSGIPWRAVIGIVLLSLLLSAPALVRWWNRRTTRSLDPAHRVQAAWRRALSSAQQAGVGGSPAMTPHEWADATANQLPVAARPMAALADVIDRVCFAPPGSIDLERAGAYGSTLRHDCELWSNQVDRIAGDTYTLPQRVKRYFTDWR